MKPKTCTRQFFSVIWWSGIFFVTLPYQTQCMEIRGSKIIEDFCKKHADVTDSIEKWLAVVKKAQWKNHSDLKADFLSTDYVGNGRYVFNIKGNNYRLVAVVIFIAGKLNVRYIGTHAEYTKIKNIEKL